MLQLEHLLELRLIPFAAAQRITAIQEMDGAEIWGQFRRSWKNENPHRNRPVANPESAAAIPLGKGTVCRMVADLRMFLKHCISREWLSANWASRDHGMSGDSRIEPKEPFSPQDLPYIYRAAERLTDGRGSKTKRIGTANGFEDLVFAWTLDYTGLRISDVAALSVDQLVPFDEDPIRMRSGVIQVRPNGRTRISSISRFPTAGSRITRISWPHSKPFH